MPTGRMGRRRDCMRRRSGILIGLCALLIFIGGGNLFMAEKKKEEETMQESVWASRAEQAHKALDSSYWNRQTGLYDTQFPCHDCNRQFHYWWQAHAIDALVDGYERAGDAAYLRQADELFGGVIRKRGGITIDYYDDMLWMALALLRLYDHTEEEKYKNAVQILWKDIQGGWNEEMGGGFAWRKSQPDYKNTPSNAPAVILAARLYQRWGQEEDLNRANQTYDWLRSHMVDPQTGIVWDGMNRTGDGRIDKDWIFSYNQGTYIGASVELYRITKERSFLDSAIRTAEEAMRRLTDSSSTLLRDEGTGDGGLFKGIFIRYLAELAAADPAQEALTPFILHHAEQAWEHAQEGERILFGTYWGLPPVLPLDLSAQLSGVMLLEKAAAIQSE